MSARRAYVYDFLQVPGGAEQVALHVSRTVPDIDMVFGFIDRERFPENVYPAARFHSLVAPTGIPGWQALKTIQAFRRRSGFIAGYDAVCFSGSYAPVAVERRGAGLSVYYCHTPPRFIYDLRSYYHRMARGWQRPALRALVGYLQPLYERSVRAMDKVLVNSNNVARRLDRFLGVADAEVLYPPVDIAAQAWAGQDGYYLSTARLEPYKRVDRVVRSFMQMPDRQLIVAGGGSQREELESLAAHCRNIRFAGWCTSQQMRDLIGRCIATVYVPMDEDFGMSPIESMAAGKPVVGVAEGGLLETVVHGETGLLIDSDRVAGDLTEASAAIIDAVLTLDAAAAREMRARCERRARRFSPDVFDRGLAEAMRL